jgi:hypothetical protein
MTIRHIDTGEYIQAQHEKIERLQAELQWHRTNLANGYGGQTATDAEIAQAIIRAYPSRFGGIASELVAHLVAMRTHALRSPTIKDVMIHDFIVEE